MKFSKKIFTAGKEKSPDRSTQDLWRVYGPSASPVRGRALLSELQFLLIAIVYLLLAIVLAIPTSRIILFWLVGVTAALSGVVALYVSTGIKYFKYALYTLGLAAYCFLNWLYSEKYRVDIPDVIFFNIFFLVCFGVISFLFRAKRNAEIKRQLRNGSETEP